LEVIVRVIKNSFFATILVIAYAVFLVEHAFLPVFHVLSWVSTKFRSYIDRFTLGDGPRSFHEWIEVLFFWVAIVLLVCAIWFPPTLWS
jgi:hypothetical protein